MKQTSKFLAKILCVLMVVFCVMGLTACGEKECDHQWGKWSVKKEATCTEKGLRERKCSECGEKEKEKIELADHDWTEANCTMAQTCKVCRTTGEPASAHVYSQEIVKDDAFKTAATCTSGAVYYKSCVCGAVSTNDAETFTSGMALDHTFTLENVTAAALKSAATCTNPAVYFMSCSCGAVSSSEAETFTNGTVSAHIHDQEVVKEGALKTEATCVDAAVYYKSCVCGAISSNDAEIFTNGSALPHSYEEVDATEATCDTAATKTYRCDCGDSYTEQIGDVLDHDIHGATAEERLVSGCEYVLVYVCQRAGCGEEVEGNHIFRHTYIASITTPATCQADGVKTLTCACGDTKTESIPMDATGHDWVKGQVADGVRTDTCAHCHGSKHVTVYEGTSTDSTNANDLKDTEIELNGANISLGSGVIDSIGDKNVTVSAEKLEGDDRTDLGLTDEELAQVGDSPIYNFTIFDGASNISQFGEENWVTIVLPYTLAEGEDVDSIAIWFINDNGELESIQATYNNGYVTFKTNHFSYYTVTRLTPAERCALYGHSYTVDHVEGSCTKDAYDLYLCVRCHHKYIDEDSRVVADGHDYVSQTQAATCTENGFVQYTCQDCDHSYRTKLQATGHAWVLEDSAEATCAADGFAKYGCDRCDVEYTEVYGKVNHQYVHTKVDATCDADGYTRHSCQNCDYAYNDGFVRAQGHSYSATTWTWADDYSSATLTFVCSRDSQHTLVLEANIGSTVITGVCSGFTKTTYTAAVSYNGRVYTDEKSVESGTPNHVFSTEWRTDANNHWHDCVCGERSDVAPHAYVDGACVCGKQGGDCDHTALHEESIAVAEYGACDWTLYYDVCACGEVKYLNANKSNISCDFEYENVEEFEDENGNECYKATMVCELCALQLDMDAKRIEDGCVRTYYYEYTVVRNGVILMEKLVQEDSGESHKNTKNETIQLSDYGCCGGTVNVEHCEDCGKNLYLNGMNPACDINLYDEPATEVVVDENGVEHEIQRLGCEDCGFEYVKDAWMEKIGECEVEVHSVLRVSCGDTVIVEIQKSYNDETHEYEETYELQGETCLDGVKISRSCSVCGDSYSYTTSRHDRMEYGVQVDISQHTSCGGYVIADICTICDNIISFNGYPANCSIGEQHHEDILDAQGNPVGYQYTGACTQCGLVYIYKQWKENGEQCSYMEHTARYLYKGTDCIISSEQVGHYTSHQWEETYEMHGNSCEDGYRVNEYCTVCGETDSYNTSGHRTEYREISLSEFGLCGGYVREEYCRICNTVTYAYANDWCSWYDVETNAEGYMVYECDTCGAQRHEKETVSAKDEDCCYTTERTVIYFQGGEVYRYISQYSGTSHVYEYEYIMLGTSCTEGVKVTTTCRDCDYYYQETIYDHENYRIFSLDAVVECTHRHGLYFYGCPCGKNYGMDISGSSFGYDEEQGMYVCADCGVSVMRDTQNREEGCQIIYTDIYLVKQGDRILYQNQRERAFANHSYSVNQVTNVNGSFVITSTCDRCQETSTSEIGNVELEYQDGQYYYDYTFIPSVSGLYTITGLADRDSYVTLFNLVDGNLVEIDRDDDSGYTTQFSLTANLTAGTTYIYRIRFLNTSNSGNISFALTQGESEHEACDHEYYQWFTVLLDGSNTCTDGALYGRVCEDCGCVITATTIYEHNRVQTEKIDLEAHGACYGSIVGYSCACGQNSGYERENSCCYDWTYNEYYDEQGRLVYVNTYMCHSCDLRFTISCYIIEDPANCTKATYYTMVISIGDRLVVDREFNVVSPSHDYVISNVELRGDSCDDGVTVTLTCSRCGDSYSEDNYYHKKYETQRVYLSDYGCVCGGYASVYTCACGQYTNLELEHTLCEWNQSWREPWIDGIITEGQYTIDGWNSFSNNCYVYTCAVTDPTACAYKIRYASYWKKEANQCIAYYYQTWQFGYNEQTGTCEYEITFKTGEGHAYHSYTDNSTDNYTKYDCPDCGSYYHERYYYDADGFYTKYEKKVSNTLNDGCAKYNEAIREYALDDRGESYTSREYYSYIYADGETYWYESLNTRQSYVGPFGDDGYQVSESYSNSRGEQNSKQYAYVYYKGYSYQIYEYLTNGSYWHKYDYTYSFVDGCYQTTTYVDSDGYSWTETNDICKMYYYIAVQQPTCTQDGLKCYECEICGKQSEHQIISPNDHNWVQIADNWYYCFTCGMENRNGASGDIILEDLTDTYGNGVNYVVGYYVRNGVTFTKYVSLLLADGTEIVVDGISFITIDGLRAVAFSKAAVDAYAAQNGYTDYTVRFSFVPYGADGSFDYAVTFTENVDVGIIVGDVSFIEYIGAGQQITYTIAPAESGTWVFTSYANADTYGELYDTNGDCLQSNDDGGNNRNFRITYYLEAGETYTIVVRWYYSDTEGNVPLHFFSE